MTRYSVMWTNHIPERVSWDQETASLSPALAVFQQSLPLQVHSYDLNTRLVIQSVHGSVTRPFTVSERSENVLQERVFVVMVRFLRTKEIKESLQVSENSKLIFCCFYHSFLLLLCRGSRCWPIFSTLLIIHFACLLLVPHHSTRNMCPCAYLPQ